MPNSGVQTALLCWYEQHKRELPWRTGKPDAYRVLVSELMLQQTVVAAVIPKFQSFLERFPTVSDLAEAELDQVLHAWQGLGYYRRARSLHAAAKCIRADHQGIIPRSLDELLALPGIGRYTASAIAAIAFDAPAVPVDGNIARIVARMNRLGAEWPKRFNEFQKQADLDFLGPRSGDVAQGLMDLGASICRPARPKCAICPLRDYCQSADAADADDFPKKAIKKAKKRLFATAFMVVDDQGRIQLRKRPESGVLAQMFELPSTAWLSEPILDRQELLQAAPEGIRTVEPMDKQIRHIFTHIELEVRLYRVIKGSAKQALWFSCADIGALALPSLTKKLLNKAGFAG